MDTEEQLLTEKENPIIFKMQGDLNKFWNKYISEVEQVDLSDDMEVRRLLTSIWIFAGNEYSRGFNQGKNNPDFDE